MDGGVMVVDERPVAGGVDKRVDSDAAESVSDEALVAAACLDRERFSLLYERYADRVYRFALSRTRSAALADDIVGDTMVAAMEGLHGFDPSRGSFAGWLFTIASRRVSDRDRRQRLFWQFLQKRPPSASDFEHEDALATTIRNERRRHVRAAIAHLSERHQQVIQLRYVADLPIRDVGAVLGISEGAVKMRLNRAMQQLARELGDDRAD